MVMLNSGAGAGGLLRFRNLISADITYAQAGTDGTAPSATQTGLIAAVAATKLATVNVTSTSPMTVTCTHTIPTTAAIGSSLQEWEIRCTANTDSVNRTVTAPLAKVSTMQVVRITTLEITSD